MQSWIVFDLDGTLLMTHKHAVPAAMETLESLGLPAVPEAQVRSLLGAPSEEFAAALAPGDPQRFRQEFRQRERALLARQGTLYPGVAEGLSRLHDRGFQLAICSSGSLEYVSLALKGTGLAPLIHRILPGNRGKAAALKAFSMEIGGPCVLVGDRFGDLDAARQAGVPVLAAAYGYGSAEELAAADAWASDPGAMASQAAQLLTLDWICRRIQAAPHVRVVGIHGPDTAGKTRFAGELAAALRRRGRPVTTVHLDDFHRPAAQRRQGETPVDAYWENAFDLQTLTEELLAPFHRDGRLDRTLTLLNLETDQYDVVRHYLVTSESLMLLEGVLLCRPPVEDYLDFSVFLQIPEQEVLRRAAVRDVPRFGPEILEAYETRYLPVQRRYRETCRPAEKSQIVVENGDWTMPRILASR